MRIHAAVDQPRHAARALPLRRILVPGLLATMVLCASPAGPAVVGAYDRIAAGEPCSPDWLAQGSRFLSGSPTAVAMPDEAPGTPPDAARPATAPLDSATEGSGPRGAVRPNDELYWIGQHDSLPVIRAMDAWETTYGGDDITVAIIGDGVYYRHPDLDGRIWRNSRELPNGRDDDGNGYVDDLRGWDFGKSDADPTPWETVDWRPKQILTGMRSTVQAGIVGAETNNQIGIAAVNWNARIMPLKVMGVYRHQDPSKGLDYDYAGAYPEDYTRAVCYAANNGARIILFSSFKLASVETVGPTIERLRVAIDHAYSRGVLTVAPAGDCALDNPWCPDAKTFDVNAPVFPAVFNHVVGVQSFQPGGSARASASFGPWVDLSAPGEHYYSTQPLPSANGDYYFIDKQTTIVSDYAAAQVAGVAGLMMSTNPDYPLDRITQKLCDGALRDPAKSWDQAGRNDHDGCGQLSAENAVELMPWQIRVSPTRIVDLTDGQLPGPSQEFVNPYLNDIRWEIRADVPWLQTKATTGAAGGPSVGRVTVNLSSIPAGMLQAGLVHTETLHACTVGGIIEHCQEIQYGLRLVDRLTRVLLPLTLAETN